MQYELPMTAALVLEMTRRVSDWLRLEYEAIRERIRRARVVYVDETGEKVMRGLKNEGTPIIPMQDIYYNHVRPHQALDGKTPAEKAGVGIDEQNKWLGLIKKSLETKRT